MAASFFFYDLETSGIDPRRARVVQFGGQRTNLQLEPIGEPVNILIKLTPDILPDPDAVLVTGITPQATLADGMTEAEFLQLFQAQILQPDTIFMGFNSIRFDDEFMRFLHYRNFYDAYEWQWQDGRSRWDLLDVVRMTRALRPEGIKWPYASDGRPSNRLELLTSVNKLDHKGAHDALGDVKATIAVARLIQAKQPQLFDYLLQHRDKRSVGAMVNSGRPFVYSSGRYPSETLHTTAAVKVAPHPQTDSALVYDLRVDPTPFLKLGVEELVKAWQLPRDEPGLHLPVKTVKFNRCPAVAPLGVINDQATQERLELSLATVKKHLTTLQQHRAVLADRLQTAVVRLDESRAKTGVALIDDIGTVDSRLYDGFVPPQDKSIMQAVRAAPPEALADFDGRFKDGRLNNLLPLYKARNYPGSLTAAEHTAWEAFRRQQLFGGGQQSSFGRYFRRLSELSAVKLSRPKQFLLEELRLYGESIAPADGADSQTAVGALE